MSASRRRDHKIDGNRRFYKRLMAGGDPAIVNARIARLSRKNKRRLIRIITAPRVDVRFVWTITLEDESKAITGG